MKITIAANRHKSLSSSFRCEDFNVIIAAQSFRIFFDNNVLNSSRSVMGVVTLRARCTLCYRVTRSMCTLRRLRILRVLYR